MWAVRDEIDGGGFKTSDEWRNRMRSLTSMLGEMPRFAEFSSMAANKYQARDHLRPILDRWGMLHLLDMKPWDVYQQNREIPGGNEDVLNTEDQ